MIGLFVVAEIFSNLASPPPVVDKLAPFRQSFLTLREWKDSAGNFLRSGAIGAAIGIIPGVGGVLANFVCYDQAKKASREPETFGKGNIQGLIASETGNNAVIGGALIPLLTLGIPGDMVTAALMGGLQLHGLDPGPLLFRDHPDVIYTVYATFFVAAIFMFLAMVVVGARCFPLILRIPRVYVLPVVLVACIAGCYNINTSMIDVWVALSFGVIGYFFQRYGYPTAPAVIGLILGLLIESNLRKALLETDSSLLPFITTPTPAFFLLLAVLSVCFSLWQGKKSRAAGKS
jgi:putative tricarboxylic transport membrane protein